MSEQRWTIYCCPECGSAPQARDFCLNLSLGAHKTAPHERPKPEPVTVVPESLLSESLAREQRLRSVLTEIVNVLGTGECPENECEGCSYEMWEAAKLAREALSSEEEER